MRYRIIEDDGWYYVKTSHYGLFWSYILEYTKYMDAMLEPFPIMFATIDSADAYIRGHFNAYKTKEKLSKSIVKEYDIINGDLHFVNSR